MKKWTKVLSAFVVATVMSASMATAIGCGGDDDDEVKHVHNYSQTWITDGDGHWHECQNDGCDAKQKDYAKHDDLLINGTETAGEDGLCDVCGYKIKDVSVTPPGPPSIEDEDPTIVDGKITNRAQFLAFRDLGEISEGNYKLEADIDMEGIALPDPTTVLTGTATFDGQGHTIMNAAYTSGTDNMGLVFAKISGATVTNVKFLNCSVTSENQWTGLLSGHVESKDGTNAEAAKTVLSKLEFNSCTVNSTNTYGGLLYGGNKNKAYIEMTEITVKNGSTVVCSQYGALLAGDNAKESTLVFKNLHLDGKFTSSSNGAFIAGRDRGDNNITIENAVIKAEAEGTNGEGQNGLFVGNTAVAKLTLKNILIVKTDNYYITKSGVLPKATDYSNIYVVNDTETPVQLLHTKATSSADAVVGYTAEDGTDSVEFLTEKGFDFTDVWMAEGDGYRLKAASTNIKSPDATLTTLKVSAINAQVRYKIGETNLSTEGLLVMGVYSDGVQLVLNEGDDADYTVDASGIIWEKDGKYEVTVKGVGNTITAKYEIEVVKQTGFKVYQDRMAHVYLEGAKDLDKANLAVKSVWTDGKEEMLKLGTDYTIDGYDLNVAGKYTAKVHNGSFDAQDIEINVVKYIPVPVDGIVYVNVDKKYDGVQGAANKGIVNFNELGDAIKYLEACKLNDDVTKIVYVGEGTFAEHIETNLANLTLIGKGKDKTVMTCSNVQSTYNPLNDKMFGLNENATLIINGEGFKMYNMAVRNDFDYPANLVSKKESGAQGTALMINGDKAVIYDCLLYGNQDTLYFKKGRVYLEKTEIQGNIDFIFGEANGLAFFENCTIKAVNKAGAGKQEKNNGYVTAMRATADDKPEYGYIFNKCAFTDDGTILDGSMSLGRPWGAKATVAMVNCSFTKAYSTVAYGTKDDEDKEVKPRWYDMSGNSPLGADFKEFGSTGEGAISTAVAGGSIMTEEDAVKHTKANIFAATNGKCNWTAAWDCDADLTKLQTYGKWEFVAPGEFAYDVDGVEFGDEGEFIIEEGKEAKFGLAAGPWNSNDKLVAAPVIADNKIVAYEDGVLKALKAGTTTLTVSKDGIESVTFTIVVKEPSGTVHYDDVKVKMTDLVTAGTLTVNGTAHTLENKTLATGIVLNTTTAKVTEHKKTIGGVSFEHRVILKTKGNYFAITTQAACTIKVYAGNGSSSDTTGRLIGLYTDAEGATLVDGTDTTNIVGGDVALVEFAVKAAGTYYLESPTNELGIYGIEIVYPAASAVTAENVTMKATDLVTAGTLTINGTAHTLENKTLATGIVLNTTTAKVTEHKKTIGGVSFEHRIILKTKGNYFAITTQAACTIKVYAGNGSSSDTTGRLIGLYTDAAGATLVDGTDTTNIVGGDVALVEFTVKAAGTYYLESPTNELGIYGIEVIYS